MEKANGVRLHPVVRRLMSEPRARALPGLTTAVGTMQERTVELHHKACASQ